MKQISRPFLVMLALAVFSLGLMFYSYRKQIIEPLDQEKLDNAQPEIQATK